MEAETHQSLINCLAGEEMILPGSMSERQQERERERERDGERGRERWREREITRERGGEVRGDGGEGEEGLADGRMDGRG